MGADSQGDTFRYEPLRVSMISLPSVPTHIRAARRLAGLGLRLADKLAASRPDFRRLCRIIWRA